MKPFIILPVTMAVVRAGFLGGPDIGGSRGVTVAGGPPILYEPAPLPSYGSDRATGPVGGNAAVIAAPVAAISTGPRLHEIHTHSPRPVIRLEEFSRGGQIIRVHEAPQAPPQIIKVQAPAARQDVIRVIAKSSGPARVERFLHQVGGAQVINVQKPGPAPARIVQIVRGLAPAPRIEFIQEPDAQNHVYVAQVPASAISGYSAGRTILANGIGLGGSLHGGAIVAAPVGTVNAVPIAATYAPSTIQVIPAAPAPIASAAPTISLASPYPSPADAIPVYTKIIKKYY